MALGIVVGLVIGIVVIGIVESLGHMVFPPPEGTDLKDPAALAAIMKDIPLGAKMSVLVAWAAGVLAGGYVAMRVAGRKALAAWVVAGLLFAFAALTMVMIPHPVWMMVGAVLVTIGAGYAATKLASA